MPQFYYRVVTSDGQRTSGLCEAGTKQKAQELLLDKHAAILELSVPEAAGELEPSFRVSLPKMAIFFRRLATMLGAGIQLIEALDFLGESEDDPELKRAVEALSYQVTTGSSMSGTLRGHRFSRMVSPVSIGMIQMGEQTGELLKVIDKVADQIEHNVNLTRSIRTAVVYPVVLFIVIVVLALLFTLVLGPGEGGLFASFGGELPWPTRVVQQVSNQVKKPLPMLALTSVAGLCVAAIRRRLDRDQLARLRLHALLLRVPGLGLLIRKTEISRMLYVMADGLAVGLPLSHCLQMARDVCRNEVLKKAVARIHRSFSDGEDFAAAMGSGHLFPSMVLSMLEVGLESGRLDSVMERICHVYEEEVEMALGNFARLAEPVLLCFAGAMAAFFALAALLPIINMTKNL